MYAPLQYKWRYLLHYCKASNGSGHGVHSPFVFQLITQVLKDDRYFYAYAETEAIQEALMISRGTDQKYDRLLFRLVNFFAPAVILELGADTGIHTALLSAALTTEKLISIPGKPVLPVVEKYLQRLRGNCFEIREGAINAEIANLVRKSPTIDFVFIHPSVSVEALYDCFEQLLPITHPETVMVLYGQHLSAAHEAVWEKIQAHPSVTLSIDVFAMGMVFFRKEQMVKQHFSIRF